MQYRCPYVTFQPSDRSDQWLAVLHARSRRRVTAAIALSGDWLANFGLRECALHLHIIRLVASYRVKRISYGQRANGAS